MRHTHSGFTLAELAIVMVIIGLITGGILGGQALIAIAETRSVISDVERYRTSIGLFEQQYFALPGDMQNATDFWATSSDGDGDGLLPFQDSTDPNEALLAWQHLSLAELEPNALNPAVDAAQPAVNIPSARVGGGYSFYDGGGTDGLRAAITITSNKNFILLGRYTAGENDELNVQPVMSPVDAGSIDEKMDDGRPESGQVYGRVGPNGANCITGSDYDYSNEQPTACIMEFRFP